MYTRGFATEYALEVSKRSKSNIAILTDFDASGLLIANKLSNRENIYWLGIRPEMVKDLGIQNIEEVEEEYIPQTGHYDTLIDIATATLSPDMSGDLILRNWLPYLRKKRIEIDSVLEGICRRFMELYN